MTTKATTKKAAAKKTTANKATKPAKTNGAKSPDAKATTKAAAAKKITTQRKPSALESAVRVLGETNTPMTAAEMIEAMAAKGYWTSPGGKTPANTLYAAILRELQLKGNEARFVKTERGKFALAGTNAAKPSKKTANKE